MQKLRIALAVLVTAVWLVGYILAWTSHTSAPTELTGLMAVVLGWAFAGQLRETARARVREAAKRMEREDEERDQEDRHDRRS